MPSTDVRAKKPYTNCSDVRKIDVISKKNYTLCPFSNRNEML